MPDGDQQEQGVSRDVRKFGLYALELEELPCGLARAIPRQGQKSEHCFGGSQGAEFVVLARIFLAFQVAIITLTCWIVPL